MIVLRCCAFGVSGLNRNKLVLRLVRILLQIVSEWKWWVYYYYCFISHKVVEILQKKIVVYKVRECVDL